MKRPAIFFDRDNTIIVSDGYLGDPEKVVLMPGAADAVARARELGFATVIVSNQSGVARGMFDEEAVHAVNRRLDQMLLQSNPAAVIDRHEFCPFHPDASLEQYRQDNDQRKPRPGMILSAAEKLALDLPRSWLIGDAPRDVEAGKAAGCRTILLHLPDMPASPAASAKLSVPPDSIVTSLKDAIDFIETALNGPQEPPLARISPAPSDAADRPSASQKPQPHRMERLAEQILDELRKLNQKDDFSDFSVSKLLAGIVQVLALAMVLLTYLNRDKPGALGYMFTTLFLQTLTISLLIMGKQK